MINCVFIYLMNLIKRTLAVPAFVMACAFTAIPGNDKKVTLDIGAMDKSVSPAADFYTFANGTWVKNNPVPAAETRWGSFDELREANNRKLRDLIEEVAANKNLTPGSSGQQLRDFYLTAMDTVKLDKQDMEPLKPYIAKVNEITSKSEMLSLSGSLQRSGMRSMFRLYVGRDLKKSDQNIIYLSQGGLSLPDRDYYLKSGDRFEKIRAKYLDHVTKMLTMAGRTEARKDAELILAIETQMAVSQMSRVDMRDEEKTYNPYTIDEFVIESPNIAWFEYFKAIKCPTNYPMVVNQPEYFRRLNTLVDSIPLNDWKTYMVWKLVTSAADNLSSRFENEDFNFYGTTLNGQQQMKPRWNRSLNATNGALGEVVGQLYVKKYFSPQAKARVEAMVKNIMEVYKLRINSIDWMSDETRVRALEKLAAFNTKLAYPNKWKDYSKIKISRDSYLGNSVNASEFFFDDMIRELGKPVDKEEWGMTPQTVNAYYDPTLNEIVFPAAIMQPPFFYADGDDAINYGAIGAVIGHEITHGFDDQGSKYDGKGNLNDWWTDKDREAFDARAKKLVDQYGKFEALPGVFVNGELTLGENIADLGGVSVAYQALQLSLKGKKKELIDGLTPEQRFFVAYAQLWKGNIKDEALQQRIMTDPHSPGNYRVLGVVSNLPEFYQAFSVKPGDKMHINDDNRAKIW